LLVDLIYLYIYPHIQLICEDVLPVSLIGAMDGNQSLKHARLHEGLVADPRSFQSTYYIEEDTVDKFKYDIKPHSKKPVCSMFTALIPTH